MLEAYILIHLNHIFKVETCLMQYDLYYTLGIDFRYKLYFAKKSVRLKTSILYKVILESLFFSLFVLIILTIQGSSHEKTSFYPIYAQKVNNDPFFGMNMRGYYTSMPQERNFSSVFPQTITRTVLSHCPMLVSNL